MDPLTALGTAVNIVTFIDYSYRLVVKTSQIYSSINGASDDASSLEGVLNDFVFLATKLAPPGTTKPSITNGIGINSASLDGTVQHLVGHSIILANCTSSSSSVSGENEAPSDPMQKIAAGCVEIAEDMLRRLEKLRAKGGKRVWSSVGAALRELWKESEIEKLKRKLEMYRRQLELHTVVSLRDRIDLLFSRQADQFDDVKTSIQDTIREMLEQQALGPRPGQPKPAPALVPDSVADRLAEEHERTRRDIIKAMNDALDARKLQQLDLSHFIPPTAVIEAAREFSRSLFNADKRLLDSLKFPVMLDREDDIAPAERATFDWIFNDSTTEDLRWDNFLDWLHNDQPLYWVTGKAGSGKSTLMKHLFCHSRTRTALQAWGRSVPLAIAGFFFWNTGSGMQKTQEGLLRSLIYQVVSAHRELIPIVFSDAARHPEFDLTWTTGLLTECFRKLVGQTDVPLKICFFIDGLDEYNGIHGDIAELLKRAAGAQDIKVCLSSRPLVVFERAFGGLPRLMLQNLTFEDIKTYVTNKFNDNVSMVQLQQKDPALAKRLSTEIVTKAAGVFLWVKFVVRSLMEGLDSFDRGSDLEQRLRELPDDLERLYWHMLNSIKPAFYREQGFRILQLVYRANKPFRLLNLAFADLEDGDLALRAGFDHFDDNQLEDMCVSLVGRLKTRCLGLLEVTDSLPAPPGYQFRSGEPVQMNYVRFMHQSVADFLETTEVKRQMEERLGKQLFNPNVCLMRATLLAFKHIEGPRRRLQSDYYMDWWNLVIDGFIMHALREELETETTPFELIQAFDVTLSQIMNRCAPLGESRDYETSPKVLEGHWYRMLQYQVLKYQVSSTLRYAREIFSIQHPGHSLLSLAIEHGLYIYTHTALPHIKGPRRVRKIRYALQVDKAVALDKKSSRKPMPHELREELQGSLSIMNELSHKLIPCLRQVLPRKWRRTSEMEVVALISREREIWESFVGDMGGREAERPWVEGGRVQTKAKNNVLLAQTAFA
ncbi:hypothetical protein B0T19DRAFT_442559 [Cercophora scortea]|uniref:NACHT domain-containing protein n=1 Tax=Cercophora scortea TaxID=314031 RepID=A0AAE0MDX5_9PEZI|nr:hypothetical protein B0T19DRAFT_442559 [Cercophora scortea]